MTSFLLFCTAAVPINMINTLFANTGGENFYSLVRSPDQANLDLRFTPSPVQPFDNGFEGKTITDIESWLESRLPPDQHIRGSFFTGEQFAVLDSRSVSDGNTILIYYQMQPSLTRPWQEGDDQLEDEPNEWYSWRVKFQDSYAMTTALDYNIQIWPTLFRPELVDEHGVFDIVRAQRVFAGKSD